MLRKVYQQDIPLSNWIKLYYWKNGIACWKTNVDSQSISNLINNLMPNFYICGENYSTYQAWCEGALLTSNSVIDKIALQYSNQNTRKKTRKKSSQKTRRIRRHNIHN
jgi:monoamine oxidase